MYATCDEKFETAIRYNCHPYYWHAIPRKCVKDYVALDLNKAIRFQEIYFLETTFITVCCHVRTVPYTQSCKTMACDIISESPERLYMKMFFMNYNNITETRDETWIFDFFKLMKTESIRLETFTNTVGATWNCDQVSPCLLANAGFFKLNDNKVMCAFCRGIISNWQPADRPLYEHALHFPLCPFIMEVNVGNVPIGPDPILDAPGEPCCGGHMSRSADIIDYKTYEQRLASYASHETLFLLNIRLYAEAGLYYIGPGGRLKCFHCFGGLHIPGGTDDNDPWVLHAGTFPTCGFMRQEKGQEFIDESVEIVRELQLKRRAIGTWMRAHFVRDFIDLKMQPRIRVFEVMNERWEQHRQPFTSFSQLYDACINRYGGQAPLNVGATREQENEPEDTTDSDNSIICKICYEKELGAVLLPCCHIASCKSCTRKLNTCPICRHTVQSTLKIFFS
ncbi:unnamed protein product [Medioppia subpectinata]|uniref:RING-type domain-containing protein n=1 Tax=Medioppia subpectinata TaxID=1979941 RepID=A0A7R9KBE3_9ACAR|nr:unnamed protein product [Medioppia subpectinata]CAG2100301.1 unnamed protein product [Medioppia subpectinata]